MTDLSGRWWITYNGELYNYIELRSELQAKGVRFRTNSDTEVVLAAYIFWGDDCVERFNGMFAFAIWDTDEEVLFCARDHLGIKPLVYFASENEFAFASEAKALVRTLPERPTADVAAMAAYLDFSFIPGTATMFRDIHRLPAGSRLRLQRGDLRITRYWQPVFGEPQFTSQSEAVEKLAELLHSSLRIQVRSDVPIGAHLSGGIDSSAVCCLAAEHVPHLKTFTARYAEGESFDESAYAKLVSRQIGSEYHEVVPAAIDVKSMLPRIIYSLDQPVEGAAVFGKYHIAELVSNSVKVVLGGQGGDELFGGYDWYVKAIATAAFFGGLRRELGDQRWPLIKSWLHGPEAKRLAKSLWRNFGKRQVDEIFCTNWSRFPDGTLRSIFKPELSSDLRVPPKELFLAEFRELPAVSDADRMFHFDMRNYLPALLHSEDRLSMAFSVESRVPLIDYRIAELAAQCPASWKANPTQSKSLLRQAVAGIIPEEILHRSDKKGFPTPIGRWLRDKDLALVDDLLLHGNRFAENYFDMAAVNVLARSRSPLSTDADERIWRVLTLAVWGQVFDVA